MVGRRIDGGEKECEGMKGRHTTGGYEVESEIVTLKKWAEKVVGRIQKRERNGKGQAI